MQEKQQGPIFVGSWLCITHLDAIETSCGKSNGGASIRHNDVCVCVCMYVWVRGASITGRCLSLSIFLIDRVDRPDPFSDWFVQICTLYSTKYKNFGCGPLESTWVDRLELSGLTIDLLSRSGRLRVDRLGKIDSQSTRVDLKKKLRSTFSLLRSKLYSPPCLALCIIFSLPPAIVKTFRTDKSATPYNGAYF